MARFMDHSVHCTYIIDRFSNSFLHFHLRVLFCYCIRDDIGRCVDVTGDVIDNSKHVYTGKDNNSQWRRLACSV